jgi:hypothetical protein
MAIQRERLSDLASSENGNKKNRARVPVRVEIVPRDLGLRVPNVVLVGAHQGECESSEEQKDGVGAAAPLGGGFPIEMHVLGVSGIRQRPAGRLVRHRAGLHRHSSLSSKNRLSALPHTRQPGDRQLPYSMSNMQRNLTRTAPSSTGKKSLQGFIFDI